MPVVHAIYRKDQALTVEAKVLFKPFSPDVKHFIVKSLQCFWLDKVSWRRWTLALDSQKMQKQEVMQEKCGDDASIDSC